MPRSPEVNGFRHPQGVAREGSAPNCISTWAATPSPSPIKPSSRCSVPMSSWLSWSASRKESSRTFLARGVNRMCPVGALWPCPMISWTWARTASSEIPSDSSAVTATPSPSRSRPSSRCSVPRSSWLRSRASSWASTTTRRARSVKGLDTGPTPAMPAPLQATSHGTPWQAGRFRRSARAVQASIPGPTRPARLPGAAMRIPGHAWAAAGDVAVAWAGSGPAGLEADRMERCWLLARGVGRRQLARSAGDAGGPDSRLAGARAGSWRSAPTTLDPPWTMNRAPSAGRRMLRAGGDAAPTPDRRAGRWPGEHRERAVPAGVGRSAGDDPHPGRAGRPPARQAGGGAGRAGQPGRRGPAAAHPQEPRAAQPPAPAGGQTPARRGRDRHPGGGGAAAAARPRPGEGGAAAAARPRPGAGGRAVQPPRRRGQATGLPPHRRVGDGAVIDAARRFFERAIATTKVAPVEVVTDRAATYPGVLDELLPAAWHRTEQYANNRVECDHGRLMARLRPRRGLKQDHSARVIIAGLAFVQNVRRGQYELATEEPVTRRVMVAFDELAIAI